MRLNSFDQRPVVGHTVRDTRSGRTGVVETQAQSNGEHGRPRRPLPDAVVCWPDGTREWVDLSSKRFDTPA
jgi:hypothetical protein